MICSFFSPAAGSPQGCVLSTASLCWIRKEVPSQLQKTRHLLNSVGESGFGEPLQTWIPAQEKKEKRLIDPEGQHDGTVWILYVLLVFMFFFPFLSRHASLKTQSKDVHTAKLAAPNCLQVWLVQTAAKKALIENG